MKPIESPNTTPTPPAHSPLISLDTRSLLKNLSGITGSLTTAYAPASGHFIAWLGPIEVLSLLQQNSDLRRLLESEVLAVLHPSTIANPSALFDPLVSPPAQHTPSTPILVLVKLADHPQAVQQAQQWGLERLLSSWSANERRHAQALLNQLAEWLSLLPQALHHRRHNPDQRAVRRYQEQLLYAGDIQRRMIPQQAPQWPKIDLAFVYDPSGEVGGDFFDFFEFADRSELGICIADVVGKGVPAALLMAALRTAFRLYAFSTSEPTEVLTMSNIHMVRESHPSEFATLFYGLFTANGRELTFCNAGHDPPLWWRKGRIRELSTDGFVLGVNENESYTSQTIRLQRDDLILFYTDGVIDAHNFAEEQFGRARLRLSLDRHSHLTAHQIAQNIIWDVRRFIGLADQADDITLVVAKIK
ncbi:MAG: hypothetical protein HJJLKODD_01953 [Phycisphaerae bacterium]|nr:hypothetical protein [Phycisphaerae bacterium]